jgi:hypothetical protein
MGSFKDDVLPLGFRLAYCTAVTFACSLLLHFAAVRYLLAMASFGLSGHADKLDMHGWKTQIADR